MEPLYIVIALAVLLILALVWFLATSGSRRAKLEERNRQEAAAIRDRAADRQQQVAQQEAAAAQVQADAARTQAQAERQAREAELKQQEAAVAQEQVERARLAHQEQLRQADLLDPDVPTDDHGNRIAESPARAAVEYQAAEPVRVTERADEFRGRESLRPDPAADYHTTLQPRVESAAAQPAVSQAPVSKAPASEAPMTRPAQVDTAMTQQERQPVAPASYTEYPAAQQDALADQDPAAVTPAPTTPVPTTSAPTTSAPMTQTGPVSYSEFPTEMSQRERMLREAQEREMQSREVQDQDIDLREGRPVRDGVDLDQAEPRHDGRRLADRIIDRDDQAR